jgi:hypothetical protein
MTLEVPRGTKGIVCKPAVLPAASMRGARMPVRNRCKGTLRYWPGLIANDVEVTLFTAVPRGTILNRQVSTGLAGHRAWRI